MTGWSDLPSELKLQVAEHSLRLALDTGKVSWMHKSVNEATDFTLAWQMHIPAVNDLLNLLLVAYEIRDEIVKLADEELQTRIVRQKEIVTRGYEEWEKQGGGKRMASDEEVEEVHRVRREMTVLELLLTKLGADEL